MPSVIFSVLFLCLLAHAKCYLFCFFMCVQNRDEFVLVYFSQTFPGDTVNFTAHVPSIIHRWAIFKAVDVKDTGVMR